MRLVMTIPVRNEVDILDHNLAYHLSHVVDHVIAIDNLSTDGSHQILEKYRDLGRLTLLTSDDESYSQDVWVKTMTAEAITWGADWVIHVDADEFWWPEKDNLKSLLMELPNDVLAVSAPRYDFLPSIDSGLSVFKDLESINVVGNRIMGKICHRALPEISTSFGNHHALKSGIRLKTDSLPVSVLHFPVRSWEQFENKIITQGQAYLSRIENNIPTSTNTPLMCLYRLHQKNMLRTYYDSLLISTFDNQRRLAKGDVIRDSRLRDVRMKL